VSVAGWRAFQSGLTRVGRYWQILGLLFVVNLVSAGLLALVPAMLLASGPGHLPAIHEAVDGLDGWMIVESLLSPTLGSSAIPEGAGSPLQPDVQQVLLLALLTAVASPLVAWLPASFVHGGVLLTYTEAPQRLRWRRFFWGGWRWFGANLLLGVVQAIGLILIVGPAIVLGLGVLAAVGQAATWAFACLAALSAGLWAALVEWTRVSAVANGTRNVFQAAGHGFRALFRRPLAVVAVYGLSLVLATLLHLAYRLGLMPLLPLERWLLVLLAQQTFILARLAIRLARLAGAVALFGPPASGQIQEAQPQAPADSPGLRRPLA
jgi:hypothetical protein